MNPVVVGVDPGVNKLAFCGLYGVDMAMVSTTLLGAPFSTEHPTRAYDALVRFLAGLKEDNHGELQGRVFIEAPIFGRNIQTGLKMGMVIGGLLHASSQWEMPALLVPPSSWKKGVGVSGGAGKRQVAQWLAANWPALAGLSAGDQDIVDASCIALHGRRLVDLAFMDGSSSLPRSDTPVLHAPHLHARLRRPKRMRRPA